MTVANAINTERHNEAPACGVASLAFLRSIPREFARGKLICGVGTGGEAGRENLLVSSRTSRAAIVNVGVRLGSDVEVTIGEDEEIARLIDRSYDDYERTQPNEREHAGGESAAALEMGEPETVDDAVRESLKSGFAERDLLNLEGKGPVVRLVDAMLFEALSRNASDIHVQPLSDRTLIRYRVDGVLLAARELPHSLTHALVSRVKVMAQMDVAERHAPQDGRATVTMGALGTGRSIDLRISTLPTSYGERAVIRLLDNARGAHLADFGSLGMPREVEGALLDRASRSHGIILVTGPTGSGKTTTLYTLLRHVAKTGVSGRGGDVNVMTIEDPIEYELSTSGIAVSQSQINLRKGVTFATGLRHILRQDPDVVMVGEIRDTETAKIALQASLTGHLVLSTLHTNDAASAVTRLVDLGVEPFLVAASLSAVMAQRLVRTRHAECDGRGCDTCLHSGYRGRKGVFELIVVDESLRAAISHGAKLAQVREHARQRGMRTLMDEGNRLIRKRLTDEREVRRVVQGMLDGDGSEAVGSNPEALGNG